MLTEDGKKSIIILTVLTPTTTLFLGLRLAMRRRREVIGVDDGLLCFALFMLYLQYVGALLRTLSTECFIPVGFPRLI